MTTGPGRRIGGRPAQDLATRTSARADGPTGSDVGRHRRLSRRGVLAGFVALSIVLAMSALAREVVHRTVVTDGPLKAEASDRIGFSQVTGRSFGYGMPVAFNTGDRIAELDAVRLLDPTPGLRTEAVYASGTARDGLYLAGSSRWPDPGWTDLHPVSGAQVAPLTTSRGRRGIELVFRLRADRPGRYRSRGVQLDYHVGRRPHRTVLTTTFVVCVYKPGQKHPFFCPRAPA